jgi:hypothetical protein
MYTKNDLLLYLYLLILAVFVIIFLTEIDQYIGGFDNCLICTKVHFNGYITNWSITHFIAFLVAGFISPRNLYFIIFAGICWEITELYLEYTSKLNHDNILCKKNIIKCDKEMNSHEFWNHYLGITEHENTQYTWSSGGFLGAIMDIIVNTFGAYTGVYLHKLV